MLSLRALWRGQRRWLLCLRASSSSNASGASARGGASGRAPNGLQAISQQIKLSGPLTLHEYMRQCLLHPLFGYYMQGDVFGSRGDFITSPDISQVFGELVAVWVLSDWMARGKTTPIQLVELGPGRGTLLKDILRVFSHKKLRHILQSLSLHLVEASPALTTIQEQALTATPSHTHTQQATPSPTNHHYRASQVDGLDVFWYRDLKEVPEGHSYFIAHEFLDALPIHQFQMTSSGWREVLVDVDAEEKLRFVLSPSPTPASSAYAAQHTGEGEGAWLEVCPQALVCVEEVGRRVVRYGGAALLADYGTNTPINNSLRAFSKHQQCHPLEQPGKADLTADVDFSALSKVVTNSGAAAWGPISQNQFLHKLGIRQRIEGLLKEASPEEAKDLVSSYEMLTSPEKMGERFKFFAITSSPSHSPVPFFDDIRIAE